MGKVLITKLDVTYNNPDAPVIELLNNFTLAAIQASGNDSMSLNQQYALNYFFKQIGAFDNSGIFAKLDYLILPMIAGGLDKTCVNYKDNSVIETPSSEKFGFSNNSLTYIGDPSGDRNIKLANTYTRSSLKISFAAITNAEITEVFRNGNLTSTYGQRYSNPRTSISVSGKLMWISQSEDLRTEIYGGSIDDANQVYVGQQVVGNAIRNSVSSESSATNIGESYVARLRVDPGIQIRAALLGDYLTASELSTLLLALNSLKTAFVTA